MEMSSTDTVVVFLSVAVRRIFAVSGAGNETSRAVGLATVIALPTERRMPQFPQYAGPGRVVVAFRQSGLPTREQSHRASLG